MTKDKTDKIMTLIRENVHTKIIITIMFLCAFGCMMVFSASSYTCSQKKMYNYDSMYMLKRQVIFMLAGFGIIIMSLYVNLSLLIEKFAIPIYCLSYLMVFLLLSPLGISSHGATRWIRIFGMQFQVAEVVKISVIVILAYMVKKYSKHLANPILTFRMWIAGGIPACLLFYISSDLSSAAVILAIVFGTTLLTNDTRKLHIAVFAVGVIFVACYVLNIANNMPSPEELANVSFRVGRIAAWINPELYADNQGYQTLNSLYAIGSGRWFGRGIGKSIMKLGQIPEAQNDMIFAIIVEELGVIGGGVIILLMIYLLYLLVCVIVNANSLMESTLVIGIFLHVATQSFFNIAVTLNVLPNTGIGLPFISYGGTSVLCLLFEMALACSISKKNFIRVIKREMQN